MQDNLEKLTRMMRFGYSIVEPEDARSDGIFDKYTGWVEGVHHELKRLEGGEALVAGWLGLPTIFYSGSAGLDVEELSQVVNRRLEWLSGVISELSKQQNTGQDSQAASEAAVAGAENASDKKTVFVVHGRNEEARKAMFAFLRSLKLYPLEWSEAVMATGHSAPYVGDILDRAFSMARAVVVLMTPDDSACLQKEYVGENDPPHEREPSGQARPNVIFEAGMAMGRSPERTVLVEVGTLRPFSDIGGRHVLRFDGSTQRRQDLAQRLKTAGCDVETDGVEWHSAGDFPVIGSVDGQASPFVSKPKLLHENGVYWMVEDEVKDGPFCTACYDVDGRLVRMHYVNLHVYGRSNECPNCQTTVNNDGKLIQGRRAE